MTKIVVDMDKFVVYQYIPHAGLIAFDVKQAIKIKEVLSKHGKTFNQIPAEETMSGQLFELDNYDNYILSGNYEVVRLCDLDYLPLATRIKMDIEKWFRIK